MKIPIERPVSSTPRARRPAPHDTQGGGVPSAALRGGAPRRHADAPYRRGTAATPLTGAASHGGVGRRRLRRGVPPAARGGGEGSAGSAVSLSPHLPPLPSPPGSHKKRTASPGTREWGSRWGGGSSEGPAGGAVCRRRLLLGAPATVRHAAYATVLMTTHGE